MTEPEVTYKVVKPLSKGPVRDRHGVGAEKARELKVAVVMMNLGSPESLGGVERFLYNLFSDPLIIPVPLGFIFQKPLAKLISKRRAEKSRACYEAIGGSPLLEQTQRQAKALEARLSEGFVVPHPYRGEVRISAKTFVCMRYSSPFSDEVAREVADFGADVVVLLSLYPHYSVATTETSIRAWSKAAKRAGIDSATIAAVSFCAESSYVAALRNRVTRALAKVSAEDPRKVAILFSAHSLPRKLIDKGDPYLSEIQKTVALTMNGIEGYSHFLAFQSKVGPIKWLEPSVEVALRDLRESGFEHVVVCPVSFVSDHVETLYEIDILFRNVADELGFKSFIRTDALLDEPDFIECLSRLTKSLIEVLVTEVPPIP
ncbi:MAG: ferrochelatase [Planctomycetes bacterium]|nr:ferrochelatase [Planctomycetota bacterium]